jgi:hypothetical protein
MESSNTKTMKTDTIRSRALRFAAPLILLGLAATQPAMAGEWVSVVGKKLEDNWTTKGPWVLNDDGVFHLPEQKEKTWKRYDHYLIIKDHLMEDFEIEFEVKTNQNSGLYFHIPDLAKVPERKHVEVQIFENSAWPKGKPLGDHAAGGIIPGHPPTKDACKPGMDWNKYEIRCVDNQLTVKINGEVVNKVDLNKGATAKRSKTGGFAFQDHGHPVWVRNIRLKNLDKK